MRQLFLMLVNASIISIKLLEGQQIMSFAAFFRKYPLFHYDELVEYLSSSGGCNQNTLKAALQYHLAKKHLARIRRGYYLVTNDYLPGFYIESDHLLIAGRMTNDAVISYHTAMEFHALAYSLASTVYFNSDERIGLLFSEYGQYQQLSHPTQLKPDDVCLETKLHNRMGVDIRVTTIERTLADCLHRPELAGGWEEIWRSFESMNFLDIERLINYAIRLGNATTIAKVGFFLEQHQEHFSVKEDQLHQLAHHKPKSRHYMEKAHIGPVKSLQRWNLVVPLAVMNKIWEEPSNDSL